jgi:holliday junction DNA helicase RuvB
MNDINDVRPTSIHGFRGQPGVVDQVKVALDAAHQDGRRFDHAMMTGGSGLGKTEIAHLISLEMGTDCLEYLGGAIQSVGDLNAILLSATADRTIISLDEAHELPKPVQTALFLAIDRKAVILQGSRRGATPIMVPIADVTILLCSTDEWSLLEPLRTRMRLNLRFLPYASENIEQILRMRLGALNWPVEDGVLAQIAAISRGVPRLGLRIAQACRRVVRSEGESVITSAHLERACLLENLDSKGLGPSEQEYLRVLLDGACRLNVIASRVGLPARTVAEVIEPYLIRSGLVVKDDQSRRELTAEGREHLGLGSQIPG